VAVELEVPVGVGGEPVVVAAVQDDGVVVADALGAHQLGEVVLLDDVTDGGLLQLLGPVQPYGALDVAHVVGGHVLVDLDEDDLRVVQVALDPVGVDEHVSAAHSGISSESVVLGGPSLREGRAGGRRRRARPGVSSGRLTEAAVDAAQVDRATLDQDELHSSRG
jgi:hypothetical protein